MFSTYLAFSGDRDMIAAVATGRAPTTRSAPEHTIPARSRRLGWARRGFHRNGPRPAPEPVSTSTRWIPYVADHELEPARAC